jgi:hypothetical protein
MLTARLGNEEELGALKRLDDQARRLERHATGPSVEAVIAEERERSHEYGGRSVFGWEEAPLRLCVSYTAISKVLWSSKGSPGMPEGDWLWT